MTIDDYREAAKKLKKFNRWADERTPNGREYWELMDRVLNYEPKELEIVRRKQDGTEITIRIPRKEH